VPSPELPASPVSQYRQHAIMWRAMLDDLTDAGFTEEQAFDLLRDQWSAYHASLYEAEMAARRDEQ
jgi:hypothetical protein